MFYSPSPSRLILFLSILAFILATAGLLHVSGWRQEFALERGLGAVSPSSDQTVRDGLEPPPEELGSLAFSPSPASAGQNLLITWPGKLPFSRIKPQGLTFLFSSSGTTTNCQSSFTPAFTTRTETNRQQIVGLTLTLPPDTCHGRYNVRVSGTVLGVFSVDRTGTLFIRNRTAGNLGPLRIIPSGPWRLSAGDSRTFTVYRGSANVSVQLSEPPALVPAAPIGGTIERSDKSYRYNSPKDIIQPSRVTLSVRYGTETASVEILVAPRAPVATPTIRPNGGVFPESVLVSLASATPGATLYYTLDGSLPTTASERYTNSFTLTSSATVQARAYKEGQEPSDVARAVFTITRPSPPPDPCTAPRTYCVDGVRGNDANDGRSSARPFKTIARASELAEPGETVLIRGGTYWEHIFPARSGRPGQPITYRPYPGEEVRIAGPTEEKRIDDSQILLAEHLGGGAYQGRSYIVIQGFRFIQPLLGWGKIHHGRGNVIKDNVFEGNGKNSQIDPRMPYACFYVADYSTGNLFTGNTFRNCGTRGMGTDDSNWGDSLQFGPTANGNIAERNSFYNAGHTLLVLAGSENIVRNNYFSNEWQKGLSINESKGFGNFTNPPPARGNLVEGNTFAFSGIATRDQGAVSGGCNIQVAAPQNTIRNNRIYGGQRCGIIVNAWDSGSTPTLNASGNIIEGNHIHNNPGVGILIINYGTVDVSGTVIRNNRFNDNNGARKVQVDISLNTAVPGPAPFHLTKINGNTFWIGHSGAPVIQVSGNAESLVYWQQRYPQNVSNNREEPPR